MTGTETPGTVDIPCQEIVELITDYLEGTLEVATALAVERHLAGCDGCEAYLDQMRATVAALGRIPVDTLSDQVKAVLVAAFRGYRGP